MEKKEIFALKSTNKLLICLFSMKFMPKSGSGRILASRIPDNRISGFSSKSDRIRISSTALTFRAKQENIWIKSQIMKFVQKGYTVTKPGKRVGMCRIFIRPDLAFCRISGRKSGIRQMPNEPDFQIKFDKVGEKS